MKSILIVSVHADAVGDIQGYFQGMSALDRVSGRSGALDALSKRRYDLVLIDIDLLWLPPGEGDAFDALKSLKDLHPSLHIVVLAPKAEIRRAVRMVKAGANSYLTYPVDPEEVKLVANNLYDDLMARSEIDYLRGEFWKTESLAFVRTRNQRMKAVFEKIRSVAPTKSSVLLTGETGTGKGMLAKVIHRHSNRAESQFVSVHCGAIPDTLLESELFGHEKGAFTGATKRKLGKFEIARDGSIFLDEIGTITPPAQIKLLQVLQDGTFSRLGGEDDLRTDARVIAATNADLKKMTEESVFRKDLYYRLNVFPIDIPPLRERTEDIPELVDAFLSRLNREFQKNIRGVDPWVIEVFESYSWPGNIRELENLIERAYILETSSTLTPESFPAELFGDEMRPAVPSSAPARTLADGRRKAIEDFERDYIRDLLAKHKGKINKSAEEADISTRQLHKLMLKYGIRKEPFKA